MPDGASIRHVLTTQKRALLGWLLAALVLGSAATNAAAQNALPLAGKVFGSGKEVLFVALHGDLSNGSTADYQHDIAKRIAANHRTVTAFGLIRPGYSDAAGRKSRGSNNGRRDHYTSRNNRLVAQTIEALQQQTGASRVVALGHSGGAAQLGRIIGDFPGLIDSAILVSCPCDIRRWRQMRGRSSWDKSRSPSGIVRKVPSGTRVIALTGSNDDNTFPVLASNFVGKLTARGVPAAFVEVSGAKHSYGGALRRAAEQAASQEIRR